MTISQAGQATTRSQRRDARQAAIDGALKVFSHHGYSGASIDNIAAMSGISTRTLYKHFGDKSGLFEAVVRYSSSAVAAAHVALINQHLGQIADLETALESFAIAWLAPLPAHEMHFALKRLMNAELESLPENAIAAWHETGPLVVLRKLGQRFAELGLADSDPLTTAIQFSALISATNPTLSGSRLRSASSKRLSKAGVRTFLHGVARDFSHRE